MGRKALEVGQSSVAAAKYFEALRIRKGYTRQQIHQSIGGGKGRIQNLLDGKATWTLEDIEKFCNFFSVKASTAARNIESLVLVESSLVRPKSRSSLRLVKSSDFGEGEAVS